MEISHLVYIHGFLSSPVSLKARQVRDWLATNRPDIQYHCPFLTPYPEQTLATLTDIVTKALPAPVYLMGSSLGGFWATWLAEKYDLRAILINPAVKLSLFNSGYIGVKLNNYHTDDTYLLDETDVGGFSAATTPVILRPRNYWLMVQKGDETLDYRLAVEKYAHSKQLVEAGGDHGFQGFDRHIPDAIAFLEA